MEGFYHVKKEVEDLSDKYIKALRTLALNGNLDAKTAIKLLKAKDTGQDKQSKEEKK